MSRNANNRYVLKVENLKLKLECKDVFGHLKTDPRTFADSFSVISTHGDCVSKLPATSLLLGSTPLCENSLFMVGKENNILCCQSHPEFDLKYAVLDRIWPKIVDQGGLLSRDEVEESLESFTRYDGVEARILCQMISDFLHS